MGGLQSKKKPSVQRDTNKVRASVQQLQPISCVACTVASQRIKTKSRQMICSMVKALSVVNEMRGKI